MNLTINIPQEIETLLRERVADLDSVAKEAFLVELYRLGEITHHQLSTALGLSRYETDGVLKRHQVSYDLTATQLRQQIADVTGGRRQ